MTDMKIFCHFRRVPQVAGQERRALARAGSCVFPLWGGAFGAVGAQATGITLALSFHPYSRVTYPLSVAAGHRSASRRCIACQYARYWLRDAPCAALRWLRAAYDI